MPSDMVALGRFLKPHGVDGELKFEPYLPDDLKPGDIPPGTVQSSPSTKQEKISIAAGREAGRFWLLKPEGVNSPEEAERFTNRELWVERSLLPALPEGEYFKQDIVGCRVFDEDKTELGVIDRIIETGANDVWQIARKGGGELLIPVIPAVVLAVDIENAAIVVKLMEGLGD